jgi:hypothetical protein
LIRGAVGTKVTLGAVPAHTLYTYAFTINTDGLSSVNLSHRRLISPARNIV